MGTIYSWGGQKKLKISGGEHSTKMVNAVGVGQSENKEESIRRMTKDQGSETEFERGGGRKQRIGGQHNKEGKGLLGPYTELDGRKEG